MIHSPSRLNDDEIQIIIPAADMIEHGEQCGVPYPSPDQELSPQYALELIRIYYKHAELTMLLGFTACNDEFDLTIVGVEPDQRRIYLSDRREHPPKSYPYDVSDSMRPHTSQPDGDLLMRLIEAHQQ